MADIERIREMTEEQLRLAAYYLMNSSSNNRFSVMVSPVKDSSRSKVTIFLYTDVRGDVVATSVDIEVWRKLLLVEIMRVGV